MIDLTPVATFALGVHWLRQAVDAGTDPEEPAWTAYEAAADVRNLSWDERWKEPCNRFRDSFRALRCERITWADLATIGEQCLVDLPSDATLEEPFGPARESVPMLRAG